MDKKNSRIKKVLRKSKSTASKLHTSSSNNNLDPNGDSDVTDMDSRKSKIKTPNVFRKSKTNSNSPQVDNNNMNNIESTGNNNENEELDVSEDLQSEEGEGEDQQQIPKIKKKKFSFLKKKEDSNIEGNRNEQNDEDVKKFNSRKLSGFSQKSPKEHSEMKKEKEPTPIPEDEVPKNDDVKTFGKKNFYQAPKPKN